jgi:hypothetical protein
VSNGSREQGFRRFAGQLCCLGSGVNFQLSGFRPGIGFAVMIRAAKKQTAFRSANDDVNVLPGVQGTETLVPVQRNVVPNDIVTYLFLM